jgi:mannose-6-phosphate isomerase-like protein (cupin superfamily)
MHCLKARPPKLKIAKKQKGGTMGSRSATPLVNRRRFVCGCCATLVGAHVVPACAAVADDPRSAPLAKDEPHHHVVLQNDLIRVMRILIPPGKATLWHEHNLDSGFLFINATKLRAEVPNNPQAIAGAPPAGFFKSFHYADQHFIHRVINTDTVVQQQLAYEILTPAAGAFAVSDRSKAAQYKLEVDDARVRAWRLQLAPGEMADMVEQRAPSVRFVLSGDRILETDMNGKANERDVRPGDFAWLPTPGSRSVSNGGASDLEFVEIELK